MLGAGVDVRLRLLLRQEQARRLDDVLRAQLAPGQVGGIALGKHGDALAVDDDGVLGGGHVAAELTVHGVVLQHIGQIIRGAEVVDADDLDLRVIQRSAHDHAADTAETIDTDFDAHKKNFLSDGIY